MKKIFSLFIVISLVLSGYTSTPKNNSGAYMVVDFHQHTGFTDGHATFDYLLNQGVKYGVDVMINSEHGGASGRNSSLGESYGHIPTWVEYGLTSADFKGVARFDAIGNITDANGIKSIKWKDLGGGVKLMEYKVKITGDSYFRLLGTNHGLNVTGKTDENGNPLEGAPSSNPQEAAKVAFGDLWFFSNPIFVRKRNNNAELFVNNVD